LEQLVEALVSGFGSGFRVSFGAGLGLEAGPQGIAGRGGVAIQLVAE